MTETETGTEAGTRVGGFIIPAEHPALPGHFPGRPIVPGVVLLDHVLEALLAQHPGRTAAGLPSVKFLHPVQPGDCVDILAGAEHQGRIPFVCRVQGGDVVRGAVLLADPA